MAYERAVERPFRVVFEKVAPRNGFGHVQVAELVTPLGKVQVIIEKGGEKGEHYRYCIQEKNGVSKISFKHGAPRLPLFRRNKKSSGRLIDNEQFEVKYITLITGSGNNLPFYYVLTCRVRWVIFLNLIYYYP